jgi:Lon protease-like protein
MFNLSVQIAYEVPKVLFMVLINVLQGTAPLHTVGTAAVVVQVTGVSWPHPTFTLLVTGLCRFRLEKLVMEVPYLVGVVTQLDKLAVDDGTSWCLFC